MAVRKGCVGAGAVMHHLVFLCFFCTRQSHTELLIISNVNLEHARDETTSKEASMHVPRVVPGRTALRSNSIDLALSHKQTTARPRCERRHFDGPVTVTVWFCS